MAAKTDREEKERKGSLCFSEPIVLCDQGNRTGGPKHPGRVQEGECLTRGQIAHGLLESFRVLNFRPRDREMRIDLASTAAFLAWQIRQMLFQQSPIISEHPQWARSNFIRVLCQFVGTYQHQRWRFLLRGTEQSGVWAG